MGTTFGLTCWWGRFCFQVLSQILGTKVKFQWPPRSLLQTDVLDGYPVKDVVAIVRAPVSG